MGVESILVVVVVASLDSDGMKVKRVRGSLRYKHRLIESVWTDITSHSARQDRYKAITNFILNLKYSFSVP